MVGNHLSEAVPGVGGPWGGPHLFGGGAARSAACGWGLLRGGLVALYSRERSMELLQGC